MVELPTRGHCTEAGPDLWAVSLNRNDAVRRLAKSHSASVASKERKAVLRPREDRWGARGSPNERQAAAPGCPCSDFRVDRGSSGKELSQGDSRGQHL